LPRLKIACAVDMERSLSKSFQIACRRGGSGGVGVVPGDWFAEGSPDPRLTGLHEISSVSVKPSSNGDRSDRNETALRDAMNADFNAR
jgi:hypothetical protein